MRTNIYHPAHDNSALIPEMWAQEALMILENNLVMGQLVHRDYSNEIAKFGDTVNAHRPEVRKPTRKTDADNVTSTATNTDSVPVVLNQHIYDSFIIKDGEESLSFRNLVDYHLVPTVQGMAQFIDQLLATQVYRFVGTNAIGKLGTAATKATLINMRDKANQLKWPSQGRTLVMPSSMEAALLTEELFTAADKVGDEGTALREGWLGTKYGIQCFMDQNAPGIAAGNTTVAGAVNNGAGYAAGTTTVAVDAFTGALVAGSWLTIAGDMTPQQIVSTTENSDGDTVAVVLYPGLLNAVANDAVVTVYSPGAINQAASPTGYAAGWSKDIVVDAFSVAPKSGQMVTIGAAVGGTTRYASLESRNSPTLTSLLLDRPLVGAAANDAAVGLGPAGNYGFALHRNAIGFVNRPLAAPMAGTGAKAFVASYNGLAIRVVITYDGTAQGHRVTVDMLAGVAELDSRLAFPVYG